jgi:predicted porin
VFATAVHYNNGPLVAGATYEYNEAQDSTGAPNPDSGNTWNVAAAYDFGVLRIGGAYGTINYAPNPLVTRDDRKQWHIGVSAPITPNDVIALNYAHATTGYNNAWSDDSIGFWGVGYQHSLSKRTTLYAAYGDINQSNSDHTRASLDRAAFIGSNSVANYTFEQAVAVGIRHDF